MKNPVALVAALLLCNVATAGEVDFSFNSDAFRIFYIHDFVSNDLQSDFGLLYNDDDDWVGNVSLYLTGFASDGSNPLQAGIGGRTGYVSGDSSKQSGVPLAVGGWLKYTFPSLNRLSIRGDLFYAPSILSFGELDRYTDVTARIGYNVLKQADIYLGYRFVEGAFESRPDVKFDDDFNIGFSIRW